MILRLVAPFSQSMSPWRATATHFVPKSIIIDMSKTCPKDKKPQNLIHRLSKRSIDNKNSTNALTTLCVFDIRLPQGSLFDNPDYVYLALGTQYFWYQVLGTFLINKSWELRVRCPQGLFFHRKSGPGWADSPPVAPPGLTSGDLGNYVNTIRTPTAMGCLGNVNKNI